MRERCACLPDCLIEICRTQFFYINAINCPCDAQTFGRYLTLNADDQSGAGEGMTHEQVFGDADIADYGAGGIFDLGLKRGKFWDGKAELHVVMHFDFCHTSPRRMSVPAFTHVGIEGALSDEVRPEISYFFFQYFFVDTAHSDALLAHGHFAFQRL